MGMAASQARLLTLTARIHDVEYAAQSIQNAKVQLATQQDEVYEKYQNALDAVTLTFASIDSTGNKSTLVANFQNLFSVNAANTANNSHYALIDSRGRLVVDEEVYNAYHSFESSNLPKNAYEFALYMLYGDNNGHLGSNNWSDFISAAQEVFLDKYEDDKTLRELFNAATGYDPSNPNPFVPVTPVTPSSEPEEEQVVNNTRSIDEGKGPETPSNTKAVDDVKNSKVTKDTKDIDSGKGSRTASNAISTEQFSADTNKITGDNDEPNVVVNKDTDKTTSNNNANVTSSTVVNNNVNNTIVKDTDNTSEPQNNTSASSTLIVPPLHILNVLNGSDNEDTQAFLNYFFNKYGTLIFNNDELPRENLQQFNYYQRIYSGIQQHNGCISINDFSGPETEASTDSEWLTAMIQSGQMSIEMFNTDKDGKTTLTGVGVSSDTNLNFTATTQIDKAALAKAEAEYEHSLKIIDRKDKKFDLELNKLETERNALTKQYDSVKKVVEDNIERTFGIFS